MTVLVRVARATPIATRRSTPTTTRRDPADAEWLAERGIAYAPDYVVNAGGAIEVGVDYAAGSASPEDLTEGVGATVPELLRVADREGVSTAEAALRRIDARLAQALTD